MNIMVLNDGTTYTDLKGCKILWIEDFAQPEEIEQYLKDISTYERTGLCELITEFK